MTGLQRGLFRIACALMCAGVSWAAIQLVLVRDYGMAVVAWGTAFAIAVLGLES